MVESMQKASDAADKQAGATVKVTETVREQIPAVTGRAAAFDRLERSLNPVAAAEHKVATEMRNAEAAMRGGRSMEDVVGVLTRLGNQSTVLREAMTAAGAASTTF